MSKLYYTIGIPGSGKDTYYKKFLKNNTVHISSDKLREELLGDVNDQSNNSLIFNEMYKRTINFLKEGKDVYYNATNLSRKKRINFLNQLPECEKIAIVFAIPFEVCCERNNARERVVPQFVMERMYKSFQPPHHTEGFDEIAVVQDEGEHKDIEDILLENIKCPHDNPNHSLSCGDHCIEAAIQASNLAFGEDLNCSFGKRAIIYRAARYHDVSKYKCKVFHNMKNEPTKIAHYYNHENVSAYDYLAHSDNTPYNIIIANLIANHMVFFADEKTIQKRRELYGEDFWKLLEIIHEADLKAH